MSSAPAPIDLSGLNLVVGLGKTGLSVVRALRALGAEVAVVDTRAAPPGLDALRALDAAVPVTLGGMSAAPWEHAARVIVSPGVPVSTPEIARAAASGAEVLGDIDLFAALAVAPVVAITGSNGKSTVTTLVGSMAERAGVAVRVGGNLGTPALELLDPAAALYVLELSSFQLETTSRLDACAATVLNLSADHMDRYPDLAAYAAAKRRIYRGSGRQIINRDDPQVVAMADPARQQLSFGLDAPAAGQFGVRQLDGVPWLACGDELWLPVAALRIRGDHNVANALAALALGHACGLARAPMLAALTDFGGLPHRMELVAEARGVSWFNDSKGTNVGATVAAVLGHGGPLVLIAGGDGKGQDFTPLREALAGCARAVVLIGRDAGAIERALGGAVAVHHAADLQAAVELCGELAVPGDAVLLSPACASFDMFRSYEERGALFADAARRWAQC